MSVIQEPFPLYPGETIEGARKTAGTFLSIIQFLNIDLSVMFQYLLLMKESVEKGQSNYLYIMSTTL